MWVALKPTGPKYTWDGVVLCHDKNRERFSMAVSRLPEKHIAVSYTGDFIQVKKNENVILSVW